MDTEELLRACEWDYWCYLAGCFADQERGIDIEPRTFMQYIAGLKDRKLNRLARLYNSPRLGCGT